MVRFEDIRADIEDIFQDFIDKKYICNVFPPTVKGYFCVKFGRYIWDCDPNWINGENLCSEVCSVTIDAEIKEDFLHLERYINQYFKGYIVEVKSPDFHPSKIGKLFSLLPDFLKRDTLIPVDKMRIGDKYKYGIACRIFDPTIPHRTKETFKDILNSESVQKTDHVDEFWRRLKEIK
jgi:hypothetical protein